jgi:hypothetical protein
MVRYSKFYLLLFLLLMIVVGCEKDECLYDGAPVSVHRTVLVYLGVDNNFRGEAEQKIEQLKTNWNKNTDGNLLIYADAGDCPTLIHIYHDTHKGNVADTIEIYPSENSANPATLTRVLNRVKAYRPAASYGLVVLSHATGWLPAEMSFPTPGLRSVILDKGTNETNNYMELSDFAEAIPYKLDFIVFDACFMGSIEVAYELKDKTEYIVASPAEVLAPGFVYASMMQHLFTPNPLKGALDDVQNSKNAGSQKSPLGDIGVDLVSVARDFYEYYDNQSGLYRSATVSVVRTAGLEALAEFIPNPLKGTFAAAQNNKTADSPKFPSGDIGVIQCFGYGTQKIYFDLGDYIQQVSPERYAEFQTALSQCVIYKACTPSYYSAGTQTMQDIHAFSGLSVYIPQENYPEANKLYGELKIAGNFLTNTVFGKAVVSSGLYSIAQ